MYPDGGQTVEACCIKCKAEKEMKNPTRVTMKNGNPTTEAACADCGRKMFKIGAQSK